MTNTDNRSKRIASILAVAFMLTAMFGIQNLPRLAGEGDAGGCMFEAPVPQKAMP